MSTIEETTVFCAACGRQSEQQRLTSFSTFSGSDLDFRPAEMLRSTMNYWIMACPHCGYVAEDIGKWPRVRRNTLDRLYAYADKALPKLAYLFQKRALHCEHQKDIRGAIRAYLCAAWVCDDAGDEDRAKQMRAKCLQLTQRRMKHCRRRDWNRYAMLTADLLRRIGVIKELLTMDTTDKRMGGTTKRAIICQQVLVRHNDFAPHCCEEFDLEME
jgi:endogenous inhibitor of DNA gyrase (YacG/DUF329 family)